MKHGVYVVGQLLEVEAKTRRDGSETGYRKLTILQEKGDEVRKTFAEYFATPESQIEKALSTLDLAYDGSGKWAFDERPVVMLRCGPDTRVGDAGTQWAGRVFLDWKAYEMFGVPVEATAAKK